MKAFHSQVRDEPSLSSDEGASFVGSGQEEIVNYEGSVTSTPTDGSRQSGEAVEEELNKIAGAENRAIWCLRLVIAFIMLASTVGVALIVYFYVKKQEDDQFESIFKDDAVKIFENIGDSLYLYLGAIDAFAATLVSAARFSNQSWPTVTLVSTQAPLRSCPSLTASHHDDFSSLTTQSRLPKFEVFLVLSW